MLVISDLEQRRPSEMNQKPGLPFKSVWFWSTLQLCPCAKIPCRRKDLEAPTQERRWQSWLQYCEDRHLEQVAVALGCARFKLFGADGAI